MTYDDLAQCYACVHFIKPYACKAFEKIPVPIINNIVEHTNPYKGDHGIRFELKISAVKSAGFPLKGGEGSGNFGHEGRPGEVGGSGGGGGSEKPSAETPKEEVYHTFAAAGEAFEKYYKTLPDGTQEYLVDYCDGEYAAINTYLRTGGLGEFEGRTDLEYIKDAVSSMTQVIDESPKYEGTVYRGAAISRERAEMLQSLEKGDRISMAGFTSTSVSETVARQFSPPDYTEAAPGVMYTIDNAKGSAIGELSGVPGEKEVVLQNGAHYEVQEVNAKWGRDTPFLYVHLKMV